MREVTLRVKRFDPSKDGKPAFQEYAVPVGESTTVLEALLHAKSYIDHSIALRYSCRMSSCGSCGMKVEGRPRLGCETQLSEFGKSEITVEPMDNYPIVRDLVVDLEGFFNHHRGIMPYLRRNDAEEQEHPSGEYIMKSEKLEEILQFTYCIKCGLCTSSCPTVATDGLFPGPQALAQSYRYLMDSRDEAGAQRLDIVNTPHGVWGCHFSGSCSAVCPKGVDPALGIQLLRRHVMTARGPRREAGEKSPTRKSDTNTRS